MSGNTVTGSGSPIAWFYLHLSLAYCTAAFMSEIQKATRSGVQRELGGGTGCNYCRVKG